MSSISLGDVTFKVKVDATGLKENAREMAQLGNAAQKVSQAYGVQEAATLRLIKEKLKLERIQKQLNKAVKDGKATRDQASAALRAAARQAVQNVRNDQLLIRAEKERQKEARRTAMEVERAAEEQATALQRLDSQYASLKGSIDPVFKAQMDLNRVMSLLDDAVANNRISVEEARATLQRYKEEAIKSGVAFDNFNRVLEVKGRRAMRFATSGLQQAGYQVGDFAVQVQSGTNVAVAFGQQMSQLLGILGPWGAVAGAAVAIATAFIAPLLRDTAAANALADALSNAEDAMGKFNTASERLAASDLDQTFGQWSERVRSFQSAVKELNAEVARMNLGDALGQALANVRPFQPGETGTLTMLLPNVLATGMGLQRDPPEKIIADMGLNPRLVGAEFFEQMFSAYDEGDFNAFASAFEVLTLHIEAQRDGMDSLTASGKRFYLQLQEIVESAAEAEAALDGSAEAARQLEVMDGIRQDYIATVQQEIALQEEILRYGEDHSRVLELRNQQERQNLETALKRQMVEEGLAASVDELTEEQKELVAQAVKMLAESQKVAKAIDDQAAAAARLKSRLDGVLNTVGSILSTVGRIGFDTIGLEAQAAALRAGKSEGQAAIEAELAIQAAQLQQGGVSGVMAGAAMAAQRAALEERLRAQTEVDQLLESRRGGTSSGASKTQTNNLDNLIKEIELKEKLATLNAEDREFLEAKQGILSQLGEQAQQLTDAEIDMYTRRMQAAEESLQRQIEMEERLQQAREFAANAMTNLWQSAFQGADAFRQQLAQIILELARMAAQEAFMRIMGTASASNPGTFLASILGFQNGGVFQGGRVVPFANGGIVSGPTAFPMSGGDTGLMGEAGPEAIMPLRRGSSGRLGVEAPTPVVNQKIINVLDPSIVGDYLATTGGERAVLNVLRKNGYTNR